MLKRVEVISTDGTFDVRPRMYASGQVFSIHGMINGRFIPLATCLLSGKSSNIYGTVFRLLPRMENLRFVMLDFELAMDKAFKDLYPNVLLLGNYYDQSTTNLGCHFHYIKCVSTKLNGLGVLPKNACKITPKMLALRRLLYLSFIPHDYVLAAYDNMMNDIGKYKS